MKKIFLVVLAISCGVMSAWAQKPILPDFHADPSARVFDGKLYVYPTHDLPNMKHWDEVDWHVFSTEDLTKWTDHGVVFSLKEITWATNEAWAPDCIERNGKYYFYFPAGGQIGVAVSDSPTGPFKDALGQPLIKSKEAGIRYCIDPNVFIDDDGQAYLYFGGGRQLGVVKLKADMVTRDGPIQILDLPKFYEGVWIHKRHGIYYASYPTRASQAVQANVMVYSMAKSPLGPWEYKGQIIDNHSPNVHGSITEFKGQWYLFYHVAAAPDKRERQVCVEPLFYNGDGTIKLIQMSAPEATLKASAALADQMKSPQVVQLRGDAGGKRFDGIGVVNGGGATSVLLKDYPEPQRSQILDLVYKPKFGASVSALLVEIPGDGNATQGSMPSHMHTGEDLNYSRGYTWWILREAKKRNPNLTLDGTAWAAPGWLGNGKFWSQDTADYYVKWLQGLRSVYGLEFDAIGCRNEKGVSYEFVKMLRATLDANGFQKVRIHAFDDWPKYKFDFVKDMLTDEKLRDAIGILSAHTLAKIPASAEVRELAAQMNKPIWNTEEHVYLRGFDCAISIVKAFNENFIRSGVTKIVNWYDIAGVYPMEPFSEDPAMLLAHSPWSGHYEVREALWGYAHYGQFTQVGWQYLNGGCGELNGGGTFVTLKSPGNDYSIILETKGATAPQPIHFQISDGLSAKKLCVWRSNAKAQFVQQSDIKPVDGAFTFTLEPDSIYSLSTTTGQQKGSFAKIPAPKPFPFPYYETFDEYSNPKEYGYLPRYFADIADVFEIADRPDQKGKCLRQVIPVRPIEWAPEYMPYTILGDDQWRDYEVSVDVCLNPGDTAGVMGRINNVGPGFRSIPRGYYLTLGDDGQCQLVLIRGLKRNPNKLEGDVEQQALIKSGKAGDDSEGGPKELGVVQLPNIGSNQWHNLKLRFDGTIITGFVDDQPVLSATNNVYARGMAGLRAGAEKKKLSTPYFDNLLIKPINGSVPKPSSAASGQSPIYAIHDQP